jgi:hypothetical protein
MFNFNKLKILESQIYRRATDLTTEFRFPAEESDFSLLHTVETGSGTYSAYPLPRGKAAGA